MIIVYFSGGISKRESFGRPDLPKLPAQTVNEILALSVREGTTWQPILKERGDYYWYPATRRLSLSCRARKCFARARPHVQIE
jgi:hypothetical protein